MRERTRLSTVVFAALLMTATVVAAMHQTAADGFAAIQAAAKAFNPGKLEKFIPADPIKQRPGFDAAKEKAWRQGMVEEIAAAKIIAIREKDDDAVVRFTLPPATDERELRLQFASDIWRVRSALSYLVKGKALDDAHTAHAQKIVLKTRTSADAFESSAYSFTHVTGVAKDCKNRMDLWYCANTELHAGSGSKIAGLGKIDFSKLDALPVGTSWSDKVAAINGETYVLHCAGGDRHDFYVKLRITEKKLDSIACEWTLLSDGLNAPKNLTKPLPIQSLDGDDGMPAMCVKKGG